MALILTRSEEATRKLRERLTEGLGSWLADHLDHREINPYAIRKARHRGDVLCLLLSAPIIRRAYEAFGLAQPLKEAIETCTLMISEETDRRLVQDAGVFDAEWYAKEYAADLRESDEPLQHFITFGLWEGRAPNAYFDLTWYATVETTEHKLNPVRDYFVRGIPGMRPPSERFDPAGYLRRYPEISRSGMNPLEHFLRRGRFEDKEPLLDYPGYWRLLHQERQATALARPELTTHISVMTVRPFFHIYIGQGDDLARRRTEISLELQIYDSLSIIDSLSIDRLREPGTYLILLEAGDIMRPDCLYWFASLINAEPDATVIYSDDDTLNGDAIDNPFYKPDFSPDYLEGLNYIGRAACYRGERIPRRFCSSDRRYDLLLRMTEAGNNIWHIRRVLFTLPERVRVSERSLEIAALEERLQRTGRDGVVLHLGNSAYQVKVQPAGIPLVSIVIPTAGRSMRVTDSLVPMLEHCLDSMLERSSYKNIEIIIVHNGDLGPDRERRLFARGCKLVEYQEAAFNVSRKLNIGADHASGEILLLLNDDIEPLNSDWIERLLEHLEKPHVGVVGARLMYPDRTIQHAGVVFQYGWPDHVSRRRGRSERGYFHSLEAVRNYTAVTGACMMTRTSLYRELGGYNEELAISFNDVDYCLKLREIGLHAVYTPFAELFHFESQSREPVLAPEEGDYFERRWSHMVTRDPFYNDRELAIAPPTFEFKRNVRCI